VIRQYCVGSKPIDDGIAAKSISTAVSTLRFLYTITLKKDWLVEDVIAAPKVPQTLPVVLSPEVSFAKTAPTSTDGAFGPGL